MEHIEKEKRERIFCFCIQAFFNCIFAEIKRDLVSLKNADSAWLQRNLITGASSVTKREEEGKMEPQAALKYLTWFTVELSQNDSSFL